MNYINKWENAVKKFILIRQMILGSIMVAVTTSFQNLLLYICSHRIKKSDFIPATSSPNPPLNMAIQCSQVCFLQKCVAIKYYEFI